MMVQKISIPMGPDEWVVDGYCTSFKFNKPKRTGVGTMYDSGSITMTYKLSGPIGLAPKIPTGLGLPGYWPRIAKSRAMIQ